MTTLQSILGALGGTLTASVVHWIGTRRAASGVIQTPPAGLPVIVHSEVKHMSFSFANLSTIFDELEPVVMALIAGAANSNTPLAAITASHPVATAVTDTAMIAGKTLGALFPSSVALATVAVPMAQAVVAAMTAAPVAAATTAVVAVVK